MERVGDIYFSRDFPVLAAIATWEAAGRPQRHIRPETIAEQIGQSREQVIDSIGRLRQAGFVDAADNSTHDGEDYMVRRLTGLGLQESGLYPRPADLSNALAEVLKCEIQATSQSDPERSKKLKVLLDTAGDLGTSFLPKLAAEMLKVLAAPH